MGWGSGSHNKLIGCGASGACASGPVEEEEELHRADFFPEKVIAP
jgi:hypothetical protein